jgi:hypothetical protein
MPKNNINKSDIKKNWKICSKQKAKNCIKIGAPIEFNTGGRTCKPCLKLINRNYHIMYIEKRLRKKRHVVIEDSDSDDE